MEIELRHLVLYVVELVGDKPNGKTYIQKVCFFLQRLLHQPLGFRAHYYGPYSDKVSAELAFLTGGGFVDEHRRRSGVAGSGGWEITRFDYKLTEQGLDAVMKLKARHPETYELVSKAVRRILEAGPLDYVDLSFAAKTLWILDDSGGPMTPQGIAQAASRFRWEVKDQNIDRAVQFLTKMGLVNITQTPTTP